MQILCFSIDVLQSIIEALAIHRKRGEEKSD